MKRKILMIAPRGDSRSEESAKAVRRAAEAQGWAFFSAEVAHTGNGCIAIERSSWPSNSLSELLKSLKPDGIVVWRWVVDPVELRAAQSKTIPTIFIHRNRDGHIKGTDAVCIHWDAQSVAILAARVLLSSNYSDYAFAPWRVDSDFSRDYGEAFRTCIVRAGKHFCGTAETAGNPQSLAGWIEALPKPCGVFAANDIIGEEILSACVSLGIRVPDDVAVVGVGDRQHLCEGTHPTLSSVALDRRVEGRAAVELLAEWFEHPRKRPVPRAIPASNVVLRASSRFCRDRRVVAALEHIRLNACEEKFGPRDVARVMRVSRTHADRLFRAHLGRTILDEIHAARLERAKELLRDGKRPDYVGALCGYASHDDFRRVFRKRTGMTIRKWMLEQYV